MQPNAASKPRRTSTGRAAPPDTHSRRLLTSYSPASGCASSAEYIVGTPSNTLTRSRWMISSAVPASKRAISDRHAPAAIAALSAHVCPNAWNSGSAPRSTSSGPREKMPVIASTLRRRLAWVSSAPLGRPVVPEV